MDFRFAISDCRLNAVCLMAMLLLLIAPRGTVAQEADGDTLSRRIARHVRAGCPQSVAPWAKPSSERDERGYHVGGGAHFLGDARCNHEGTWGWDYHGRLFDKRVWLGWHHGRRDQGGVGAYRTDGVTRPFHE